VLWTLVGQLPQPIGEILLQVRRTWRERDCRYSS
jgi:hypothetical protein